MASSLNHTVASARLSLLSLWCSDCCSNSDIPLACLPDLFVFGRSVLVDGMKRIEKQCADLVRMCRQAYTPDLLEAAALQLESTTAVLKLLSAQRSRETGSI